MKKENLDPRYLADLGKGSVYVFDRLNPEEEPLLMPFNDFVTLGWMKEVGSMAGEAAHFGAISDWSKAQPFRNQEAIRDFYRKCDERGADFRLLPHGDIWKWRKDFIKKEDKKTITYYFPSTNTEIVVTSSKATDKGKTDEVDLRSWHEAMLQNSYIWNVAKKVSADVKFYDPKKSLQQLVKENGVDKFLAGMMLREEHKKASCVLSADNGSDKYWKTVPGQWALKNIDAIEDRLKKHTSNNPNGVSIKDGVAKTTIKGKNIELSLTDVLGIQRKKNGSGFLKGKLNDTQIVSCAMLIMDEHGKRYINPKTNRPYGFKYTKQFGMTSTALHQKPGHLRVKFYHHGIKNIFKKMLLEYDGSEYLIRGNKDHKLLLKFVRNSCRIAYEQTLKALIACNNGVAKTGLESYAA